MSLVYIKEAVDHKWKLLEIGCDYENRGKERSQIRMDSWSRMLCGRSGRRCANVSSVALDESTILRFSSNQNILICCFANAVKLKIYANTKKIQFNV